MSNNNTQFSTFCVRFSHPFFVRDRCDMAAVPSIGKSHIQCSFSIQLRHKTFVIIRILSLVVSHDFRLTFLKSGFRYNAIKRISSLVASNASQSYSAHVRYKDKRINTCCYSRFNKVLFPYSVQIRCMLFAYKRISSLGPSHDPSAYFAEIGSRSQNYNFARGFVWV